jgi:hypothetical protein
LGVHQSNGGSPPDIPPPDISRPDISRPDISIVKKTPDRTD